MTIVKPSKTNIDLPWLTSIHKKKTKMSYGSQAVNTTKYQA